MKSTEEILKLMKAIDAENENYRYRIAENMRTREQLLKEFNKAEEWEKEQQAKTAFIANEIGLKEVGRYL